MAEYDVVVIGAGNGGLGAAAQLALKGAHVLVLEQHNLPGGFGTSFVRGRFEFETALHILCDYGPPENGGNVRRFFDEIGLKLDLVPVPDAYRFILEEAGVDAVMPIGVHEYIEAVEREVPGSRDTLTRYLDLCKEVLDALNYIAASKGKADKDVLRKKYPNFLKTGSYSVKEVTDRFGFNPKTLNLLYPYWLNIGPPVSRINFTLWAAFLYKYLTLGGYIPKNRSHELMTALEARGRELGAEYQYNTRIEGILVQEGRVAAVDTEYGERIKTRHVICNASPTLAYSTLIRPKNEVPAVAKKYLNARKHSLGVFQLCLGLDATADEIGLETYGYFIAPHADTEELYRSFFKPRAPIVQAATCLNRAVPDCSPPGTCILSSTPLMDPSAWAAVKPEDYHDVKSRMADEMVSQFERATGLSVRGHIEEAEVATPETYARYTGAYGGVVYGYDVDSWDSIIPRMMSIQAEKYIEGLYFAGGYSFRALGYSSSLLSGQATALLTLREMGVNP